MKVLFVGGIYFVEFSLYKESLNNPNIDVVFCTDGACMPDVMPIIKPHIISNRQAFDNIKSDFKPDMTLFRSWNPTENFVGAGEVLWRQEIWPTDDNGNSTGVYNESCTPHLTAYQSKPMSVKNNGYWLPYCVSKYWGIYTDVKRDIPVMVAMSMPSIGFDMKKRSCDMLVKPIIEFDSDLIQVFHGINGGLEAVPYLKSLPYRSFHPIESVPHISRAKIYLSPTTIWHDEGCISHKTIEAMACGCLVITNKYIGIENIVGGDGENLLYSNSPEETLDKVKFYLSHDKDRETIAERGYNFVHSEYNWEKHLTRLLKEISE